MPELIFCLDPDIFLLTGRSQGIIDMDLAAVSEESLSIRLVKTMMDSKLRQD